jgi:chromosome segregation ATPase
VDRYRLVSEERDGLIAEFDMVRGDLELRLQREENQREQVHGLMENAEKDAAELAALLKKARVEIKSKATSIEVLEDHVRDRNEIISELTRKLAASKTVKQSQDTMMSVAEIARLQDDLNAARAEAGELRDSLSDATEELESVRLDQARRFDDHDAELKALRAENAELQAAYDDVSDAEARTVAAEARCDAATARLAEMATDVDANKGQLADLVHANHELEAWKKKAAELSRRQGEESAQRMQELHNELLELQVAVDEVVLQASTVQDVPATAGESTPGTAALSRIELENLTTADTLTVLVGLPDRLQALNRRLADLHGTRVALDTATQSASMLEKALEETQGWLQAADATSADLQARLDRETAGAHVAEERIAVLESNLANVSAARNALVDESQATRKQISALNAELRLLQNAKTELCAANDENSRLHGQMNEANAKCDDAAGTADALARANTVNKDLSRDLQSTRDDLDVARTEQLSLVAVQGALKVKIDELARSLKTSETSHEAAQAAVRDSKNTLGQRDRELDQQGLDLHRVQQRAHVLETSVQRLEEQVDGDAVEITRLKVGTTCTSVYIETPDSFVFLPPVDSNDVAHSHPAFRPLLHVYRRSLTRVKGHCVPCARGIRACLLRLLPKSRRSTRSRLNCKK